MKPVTVHDQPYEFYSWDEFGTDVFSLATKIQEGKQKFDRIIALAKGGVTISRPILDLLNINELSSIQIEFYSGVYTTDSMPVITQSLPVKIKGESVLILDDLADSGESFITAVQYLRQHGTKSIQTASWLIKPWSKFKPDFFVRKTSAWVIFPWEIRETITILKSLWEKAGDSKTLIHKNLLSIGFSEVQIKAFLK